MLTQTPNPYEFLRTRTDGLDNRYTVPEKISNCQTAPASVCEITPNETRFIGKEKGRRPDDRVTTFS